VSARDLEERKNKRDLKRKEKKRKEKKRIELNPLNAELIPICPLPALFGTHHILHISR